MGVNYPSHLSLNPLPDKEPTITLILMLIVMLLNVKETYGADVGCTEDGRDGRIGATRYAGGNGTRKEAEKRNV